MNYYEILEVREDTSEEVIRMAYKALIKKYHPDVYQGDKEYANRVTEQLNQAYEILSNPKLHSGYDEFLSSCHRPNDGNGFTKDKEGLKTKKTHLTPLTFLLIAGILFVSFCAYSLYSQNQTYANEIENKDKKIAEQVRKIASLEVSLNSKKLNPLPPERR